MQNLERFTESKNGVIVCTDVAARYASESWLCTKGTTLIHPDLCSARSMRSPSSGASGSDSWFACPCVSVFALRSGLDIPVVQFVVHYQLPRSSEIYVHRSGRTAR